MPTLRFTLDGVVNGAVLVVCLLMGGSVGLQLFDRFTRTTGATALPPADLSYQAGDTMPVLTDYAYADADATLILAVRSTCNFCTRSMPFYGRVVDKARHSSRRINIVAVSTDSPTQLREYLTSNAVTPQQQRTVPAGYLKIAGTPTLILVNRAGIVEQTWIGLLDPVQEAAVLSAVTTEKTGE